MISSTSSDEWSTMRTETRGEITYESKRPTRAVLRDEPRWQTLLAELLADARVHTHFREEALSALATAGTKWIPLIAKHAGVADVSTLANAIVELGDLAIAPIRATLDARNTDNLDLLLEEGRPKRKRRR